MANADFTPTKGAYTELKPFRFWCQKVLPLVYDDSLSYYELLCKVVDYLNKTMEDVDTLNSDVTNLFTAYDQLQDWVNAYYESADFEAAIDAGLDRMAEDGRLDALMGPLIDSHLPELVFNMLPDTVSTLLPDEVANQIGGTVENQLPAVVSNQIGGAVQTQLPGVVSNQIGGTVANQLPAVVSDQIGPVVEEKIVDPVEDWLETNVSGGSAVDRTLSILGAGADAAFTGARLEALDNVVGYDHIPDTGAIITTNTPYIYNYGYIVTVDSAFSDGQSHTYKKIEIPVTTGDKYRINAHKILIANATADHFAITYAFCAKRVDSLDPTNIRYFVTTYNADAVVDDIVTVPEIEIPTSQGYDETTGYLLVITANIEDPVYKVTDSVARESEITELKDDLEQIDGMLNIPLSESRIVNDSFHSYTRKTVFSSLSLKANQQYLFTVTFPDINTEQGYLAISKTDNTTPDYDSAPLKDKSEITLLYTPSTNIVCNITIRFNDSGTYGFTCSWSEVKETFIQKTQSELLALDGKVNMISNNLNLLRDFPLRYKPLYDHLFVNRTGANCTIPHESLFHVRLSRLFGFNTIEANVKVTSDGRYFVNHLGPNGTFGGYFHHVDGVTDISEIKANTVTWAWILENVRYNSTIEKYRTAPCLLEDFLRECRQQNIIPFVDILNAEVAEITEQIMGKGNFIAYDSTRAITPDAIIYKWRNDTTKQSIIDYCDSIGAPMIYGMSRPENFTDAELIEIINALHERGYWIASSYINADWYKYSYLGFDANGSQQQINRISNGNICNLDATFGFDNFVYTNATETNGILTFGESGTLYPDIDNASYSLCGVDIEINFNGTIDIPQIGESSPVTIVSDGKYPYFVASIIFNGSPKISIAVASGCEVYDLKFKATKF